jgi:hypothetical protein
VKVTFIFSTKVQEKKTVHHLSSDSESGSAEKQESDDKSEIKQLVGTAIWQEQVTISNLKIFRGNSWVKQIPTDCISVSGGHPGYAQTYT